MFYNSPNLAGVIIHPLCNFFEFVVNGFVCICENVIMGQRLLYCNETSCEGIKHFQITCVFCHDVFSICRADSDLLTIWAAKLIFAFHTPGLFKLKY